MSTFLGGAGSGNLFDGILISCDRDIVSSAVYDPPFADGVLWPNPRGLGGQINGNVTSNAASDSGVFEAPLGYYIASGGQQVKKIIGITVDFTGAPLGNCTVKGYVTSTDIFVGQTISDAGGYYEITTSFLGVAHYIVAYLAGAPDITGTSVDTLIPA